MYSNAYVPRSDGAYLIESHQNGSATIAQIPPAARRDQTTAQHAMANQEATYAISSSSSNRGNLSYSQQQQPFANTPQFQNQSYTNQPQMIPQPHYDPYRQQQYQQQQQQQQSQ
mmetsp:Transcript_16343/g.30943  ORF Transcript_16343/g.30943 Transcript_16343/m.30943 type:complete len:114 (-) Transcript_16343:1-342(-)